MRSSTTSASKSASARCPAYTTPELLVRADRIPNEDLRQAHAEAKAALLERVRRIGGQALDPALPLLGFATRNASFFNSHRMMRRNAVEAHLR